MTPRGQIGPHLRITGVACCSSSVLDIVKSKSPSGIHSGNAWNFVLDVHLILRLRYFMCVQVKELNWASRDLDSSPGPATNMLYDSVRPCTQ